MEKLESSGTLSLSPNPYGCCWSDLHEEAWLPSGLNPTHF